LTGYFHRHYLVHTDKDTDERGEIFGWEREWGREKARERERERTSRTCAIRIGSRREFLDDGFYI
jgi:hypothetical protein